MTLRSLPAGTPMYRCLWREGEELTWGIFSNMELSFIFSMGRYPRHIHAVDAESESGPEMTHDEMVAVLKRGWREIGGQGPNYHADWPDSSIEGSYDLSGRGPALDGGERFRALWIEAEDGQLDKRWSYAECSKQELRDAFARGRTPVQLFPLGIDGRAAKGLTRLEILQVLGGTQRRES